MLKKGIFTIFRANIIAFLISLITSFFLPKYLSVESYAAIKTFQFYITYIGLLHLGYADGMYLRYGGVLAKEIDKKEVATDIATMAMFQFVVSIIITGICCIIGDFIWLAFAMSIVPLNMTSYYKLLCQATGEFRKYSRIMNISTIVTFVINIVLLLGFQQSENSFLFIIAYMIVYIIIWIISELLIRKTFQLSNVKGIISFPLLISNIRSGILLMLGNLSTAILTGMDRWFIKGLMNAVAFAQYSFAVSIENFLNVAITPISVTLYNYFCRHEKTEEIKRIKGIIYIMAIIIPICAFPTKWVIENYLQKYMESISVIFLLFAAQIFSVIVRCIYINLYKTYKLQARYFIKLVFVIIAGFILNILCYSLLNTKEAFAIGTFISNFFWYIISIMDFPEIRPRAKEVFYLLCEAILFLVCGFYLSSAIGLMIYIIMSVLLSLLFMNTYILYGVRLIKAKN